MLLTLEEAKQYLEITGSGQDTLLTALLTSFTALIKTYLNRQLENTNYKQLYDGTGTNRIILDQYPIISVSKLSQDLDNENKVIGDLYSASEYYILPGGMIELYADIFVDGQRTVYVDYNAGFATIPGDIKDVCKQIIAKRYQDLKDKRFGISSKNIFDDSVSFEIADLSSSMKLVLDRYRKRPGAKGADVSGWA